MEDNASGRHYKLIAPTMVMREAFASRDAHAAARSFENDIHFRYGGEWLAPHFAEGDQLEESSLHGLVQANRLELSVVGPLA